MSIRTAPALEVGENWPPQSTDASLGAKQDSSPCPNTSSLVRHAEIEFLLVFYEAELKCELQHCDVDAVFTVCL